MAVVALAVVFASTSAGEARADVITFTNSSAFFAALGSAAPTTETYESYSSNPLIPSGGALGGISYSFSTPFSAPDSPVQGRVSSTYVGMLGGNNVLGASRPSLTDSDYGPGEAITATFASPVRAIGVFFNADPSVVNPGDLTITTSAGSAGNGLNPIVGQGLNGPALGPTLYFVGLISDTPFTLATFRANPNNQNLYFTLDNLTTAQIEGAVPAPANLLVFGVLAAVTGLRYRRRRAA
jgi:hypothetical protein